MRNPGNGFSSSATTRRNTLRRLGFHWPERLPSEVTETVFEWWRTRRMRVAVAIGTDDGTTTW